MAGKLFNALLSKAMTGSKGLPNIAEGFGSLVSGPRMPNPMHPKLPRLQLPGLKRGGLK